MAVYDMLGQNWVSFDITDVIRIKEVAHVETEQKSVYYCVTAYNEIFQLFGLEDQVYLAQVRTRGHMEQETVKEHKSQFFRAVFVGGLKDSSAEVIEYVDDRYSQRIKQKLYMSYAGIKYPVMQPVIPDDKSQLDNPGYQLKDGLTGKKITFIIQWQSDAQLVEYQFASSEKSSMSSVKQHNTTLQYGHNV